MNPARNRFAPRRLLIVLLIGMAVMVVFGMTEAALRELIGYPYHGPIAGAAGGIAIWALLFLWRGGYPKDA
jgi:hypothetical protein